MLEQVTRPDQAAGDGTARPPPDDWESPTARALGVFDRHADRLHDLALALLRDHAEAADAVADVLVDARLGGRDEDVGSSSLRLRLYAQVRADAVRRLASCGRLPPEARVIAMPPMGTEPTAAELGTAVWAALAAYDDLDQALLVLHLRHGLDGPALATAVGVSPGATTLLLQRVLTRVRGELSLLVAMLSGNRGDTQVEALSAAWDGTFSPWLRRRSRAVWAAPARDPLALLQAVPLAPAPASLRGVLAARLQAYGSAGSAGHQAAGAEDSDLTIPPEEAISLGHAPAPAAAAPPVASGAGGEDATGPAPRRPSHGTTRVLGVALALAVALVLGALVARVLTTGSASSQGSDVADVATEPVPDPPARPAVPPPEPSASDAPFFVPPGAPAVPAEAASEERAGQRGEQPPPSPVPPVAQALDPQITSPATLLVPASVTLSEEAPVGLSLRNPGTSPVAWRLLELPAWVRASPSSGTIGAGATVDVRLALQQDLPEGDHAGVLVVHSGPPGGPVDVPAPPVDVRASVDHPPVVEGIQMGTRLLVEAGCGLDSTEVAVRVDDEAGVAGVTLTAVRPDGTEGVQVVLEQDPDEVGTWRGLVGPFDRAGPRELSVTAVDVRGNAGAATAGTVTVAPCPTGG